MLYEVWTLVLTSVSIKPPCHRAADLEMRLPSSEAAGSGPGRRRALGFENRVFPGILRQIIAMIILWMHVRGCENG